MTTTALMVPGLWDSGPEHWHTHWERADPRFARVAQRDWDAPEVREWVRTLDDAVHGAGHDVVLVAHSLGCATVVHWAGLPGRMVRGALLVAPADVDGAGFPLEARGFAPMPLKPLPFPSILVASTDDSYLSLERARLFAEAWGSRLVEVGAKGHLNSASGLGDWPEGRALLDELLALPDPPDPSAAPPPPPET
jgi:predicted alpha/beta hydrolase family esterase